MKKLIVLLFCFTSICSYAQLKNLPDSVFKVVQIRIIQTANEKLKMNNIIPEKATIDDWEKVLKEIGEVTKAGNTLFCKVSNTKNATITFDKNQLIGVCERYDDDSLERKIKD